MSSVAITIEDRAVRRKLGNVITPNTVKRIITKVAITGENEGAIHSPVDFGRLKASMTHQVEGDRGWFGTNVFYGRILDQPRTRNPRYRGGPFTGQRTSGWLTKRARDATERQIPEILDGEARVIERDWGR